MTPNGTSAGAQRPAPSAASALSRVDWVDYAKGICIIMVVMMHSVLGVEAAASQTGFMHWLVMFAQPFRMPDFFLISGLFLSAVGDDPVRLQGAVVRCRNQLGPCRLSVSGVLRRAVRYAVVHLSAADLL